MTCIATYNVQVFSEWRRWNVEDPPLSSDSDKRVLSNLPAMLEAVEEDLTKLLPAGYSARITEWSSDG